MKIEYTSEKDNALFERKEVCFVVDHDREATPGRNAVAEEIAKKYGSQRNLVVIEKLESEYGVGKSKGYAKVYANKKAALKYENGKLLKRNGIEDESKKKADAAAPAADAPAQE